MLKKLYISTLFITIFSTEFVFSRSMDFDAKSSGDAVLSDLKVELRTDSTVYHYTDPINIRVSVINTGDATDLSVDPDRGFFNYYIEVFSKNGISIPERDSYFADRFNQIESIKEEKRTNNIVTGFNEISLAQNKVIGEQLNLAEMFDLKPGYYLVRVKFYPRTIIFDPLSYIYSSFISIIIKPEKSEIERDIQVKQQWDKEKDDLHTPEDSVNAFFEAKKDMNWDKFFYILDLRQLISVFAGFNNSYDQATSLDKDEVLSSFQDYLKDVNKNEKIRSVEIEETTIKQNQAIVKAIVQVELEQRLLSREYLFKLEHQSHWVITAYTVTVR